MKNNILELIPNMTNQCEETIRDIKIKIFLEGRKLFIYGAGTTAERLSRWLKEYGIMCSGYAVDSEFIASARNSGLNPIYDINDIIVNESNVVLIGFENHTRAKYIQNELKKQNIKIYYIEDPYKFRNMEYDFFLRNSDKYQSAYDLLEDELSRNIFVAHLKGRISGCSDELASLRSSIKYEYDFDLLDLTSEEIFVDCGAFDGDTILEFIEHRGGQYKKIYAFEADTGNGEKLRKNKFVNCEVIEKAVGNEDGVTLFYDDNSLGSNVVSSGVWGKQTRKDLYGDQDDYVEVPITKIDTIAKDEGITFIKMDIEGSELEALKGAQNVIINCCPKLAICVYHKSEDLFTIISYIHSISKGKYRYYLRHHSDNLTETVLYAKRM